MKKERFKKLQHRKLFTLFAIIVLLFSSLPLQALAEAPPPALPYEPPTFNQAIEGPGVSGKDQETPVQGKPIELVEERTETEKVYDNGNGTFVRKVYTKPIHIKENGKWEDVSTKLEDVSTQEIKTKKTKLTSIFKKKLMLD